jgi:hypothetical protein
MLNESSEVRQFVAWLPTWRRATCLVLWTVLAGVGCSPTSISLYAA